MNKITQKILEGETDFTNEFGELKYGDGTVLNGGKSVVLCWKENLSMQNVTEFLRTQQLELLQTITKEIENFVAQEMIIAHKEKMPTSRLTSLALKITTLLQEAVEE